MMSGKEKLRLEQLDQRPSVLDLSIRNSMDLIGDNRNIDRPELFSQCSHAGCDWPAAADQNGFKPRRERSP